MKTNEDLMLCTVEELAQHLASTLNPRNVREGSFADCDFAITDKDDDDLEYVKSSAMGWYGIKAIDTGFDSDCRILASDYYGGGCAAFTQLFDDFDAFTKMDTAIQKMLLDTLEVQETADKDTMLIVEFK